MLVWVRWREEGLTVASLVCASRDALLPRTAAFKRDMYARLQLLAAPLIDAHLGALHTRPDAGDP